MTLRCHSKIWQSGQRSHRIAPTPWLSITPLPHRFSKRYNFITFAMKFSLTTLLWFILFSRGTAREDELLPRQLRTGRPSVNPALSQRAHEGGRELNWWSDFMQSICTGFTEGLPSEDCKCIYDLGELAVDFDCNVPGLNLECLGNLICPRSKYEGRLSLAGGYETTMKFEVAGAEMVIVGKHCAEDRGEFCGDCSVTLGGRKCDGCTVDNCSGLRVTPDCDNIGLGLGFLNAALPRCMGLDSAGNFDVSY